MRNLNKEYEMILEEIRLEILKRYRICVMIMI